MTTVRVAVVLGDRVPGTGSGGAKNLLRIRPHQEGCQICVRNHCLGRYSEP
jgi:hypothetical protein